MRTALTATAAILAALLVAAAPAGAQLQAGEIVVADPNAFGGDGGLIAVDPDTGAERPVSNNPISAQDLFKDPTGIAIDAEGTLIVADPEAFGGTGGLIRVDPETGQQFPLSSNASSVLGQFVDPEGVAITRSGWLYVVDANAGGGGGAVIGVDPQTGQQTLVSSNTISVTPPFVNPFGIAIERSGTILVSDPDSPAPASAGKGAVIAVDPANGAKKLITNNDTSQSNLFASPLGITIETPGTLLVANTSGDVAANGVILVNRSSGQQYALASDGAFAAPRGITMDLDGRALVADPNAFGGGGGVIRVDPSTGARSTVAGDPNAATHLFADPSGLLVVPPTCQGRYATITGTEGADALSGTEGPDVIAGRGGDDIIDGEGGNDLVCGDSGRDRLIGHDGKDRVLGGAGPDVILAGVGADTIRGQTGNDKVDGGRGGDKLYGQQKRDTLLGGKGRDRLSGGPGADKLTGGPGHDVLVGGPGADLKKP
jgi:Ca2+-binding RTX toxin-like protein